MAQLLLKTSASGRINSAGEERAKPQVHKGEAMEATSADLERTDMKDSGKQLEELQKQLEMLHENLRTVRHSINNHVAVVMAMAELTQRNPTQSQKLCQICLEKAPQIAATIGGFTELFQGILSVQREESADPTTP
jgi:anaerobic ribonucleoside-triphosphate reductase